MRLVQLCVDLNPSNFTRGAKHPSSGIGMGGEGAGYGDVHIPPNYHYLLIAKAMLVGWDVNVPSVVSCRVKHVLRTQHNTRLKW